MDDVRTCPKVLGFCRFISFNSAIKSPEQFSQIFFLLGTLNAISFLLGILKPCPNDGFHAKRTVPPTA